MHERQQHVGKKELIQHRVEHEECVDCLADDARDQPPEDGAAGEQGQADHDTRQHARQMPAAPLLNAVLAERSGRSSDGAERRARA